LRLPAGATTFGCRVVDLHMQIFLWQAAYGLTDRLSLGVRVSSWTQENQVPAARDNRTATVGFNPTVPGGIVVLSVPGMRPTTTEDIQAFVERLVFRRVQDGWMPASARALPGSRITTTARRTGSLLRQAGCDSRRGDGMIPIIW
jgi:hypothetical protein